MNHIRNWCQVATIFYIQSTNILEYQFYYSTTIFNIKINLFEYFNVKYLMFNVNVNYFLQKDPQCQCQFFSDLNVNVNVES